MKISQNFTNQEITTSDAKLNWSKNPNHYWLFVTDGLLVVKKFDGNTCLLINNTLARIDQGAFSGSLFNRTTGTSNPILPGDHLDIELKPECRYVLIVNRFYRRVNDKGYNIETWTLEFEPD